MAEIMTSVPSEPPLLLAKDEEVEDGHLVRVAVAKEEEGEPAFAHEVSPENAKAELQHRHSGSASHDVVYLAKDTTPEQHNSPEDAQDLTETEHHKAPASNDDDKLLAKYQPVEKEVAPALVDEADAGEAGEARQPASTTVLAPETSAAAAIEADHAVTKEFQDEAGHVPAAVHKPTEEREFVSESHDASLVPAHSTDAFEEEQQHVLNVPEETVQEAGGELEEHPAETRPPQDENEDDVAPEGSVERLDSTDESTSHLPAAAEASNGAHAGAAVYDAQPPETHINCTNEPQATKEAEADEDGEPPEVTQLNEDKQADCAGEAPPEHVPVPNDNETVETRIQAPKNISLEEAVSPEEPVASQEEAPSGDLVDTADVAPSPSHATQAEVVHADKTKPLGEAMAEKVDSDVQSPLHGDAADDESQPPAHVLLSAEEGTEEAVQPSDELSASTDPQGNAPSQPAEAHPDPAVESAVAEEPVHDAVTAMEQAHTKPDLHVEQSVPPNDKLAAEGKSDAGHDQTREGGASEAAQSSAHVEDHIVPTAAGEVKPTEEPSAFMEPTSQPIEEHQPDSIAEQHVSISDDLTDETEDKQDAEPEAPTHVDAHATPETVEEEIEATAEIVRPSDEATPSVDPLEEEQPAHATHPGSTVENSAVEEPAHDNVQPIDEPTPFMVPLKGAPPPHAVDAHPAPIAENSAVEEPTHEVELAADQASDHSLAEAQDDLSGDVPANEDAAETEGDEPPVEDALGVNIDSAEGANQDILHPLHTQEESTPVDAHLAHEELKPSLTEAEVEHVPMTQEEPDTVHLETAVPGETIPIIEQVPISGEAEDAREERTKEVTSAALTEVRTDDLEEEPQQQEVSAVEEALEHEPQTHLAPVPDEEHDKELPTHLTIDQASASQAHVPVDVSAVDLKAEEKKEAPPSVAGTVTEKHEIPTVVLDVSGHEVKEEPASEGVSSLDETVGIQSIHEPETAQVNQVVKKSSDHDAIPDSAVSTESEEPIATEKDEVANKTGAEAFATYEALDESAAAPLQAESSESSPRIDVHQDKPIDSSEDLAISVVPATPMDENPFDADEAEDELEEPQIIIPVIVDKKCEEAADEAHQEETIAVDEEQEHVQTPLASDTQAHVTSSHSEVQRGETEPKLEEEMISPEPQPEGLRDAEKGHDAVPDGETATLLPADVEQELPVVPGLSREDESKQSDVPAPAECAPRSRELVADPLPAQTAVTAEEAVEESDVVPVKEPEKVTGLPEEEIAQPYAEEDVSQTAKALPAQDAEAAVVPHDQEPSPSKDVQSDAAADAAESEAPISIADTEENDGDKMDSMSVMPAIPDDTEPTVKTETEQYETQKPLPPLPEDSAESADGSSLQDAPPAYESVDPHESGNVEEVKVDDATLSKDDSEQDQEGTTTVAPLTEARSLTVDTDVDLPTERPKSPWTPSYSVTIQGPGITTEQSEEESSAPEDMLSSLSTLSGGQRETTVEHHEPPQEPVEEPISRVSITPTRVSQSDVQKDGLVPAERAITPEPIERPKSPYPPSYSVTTIGAGHSPGRPAARELNDLKEDIPAVAQHDALSGALAERLSSIEQGEKDDLQPISDELAPEDSISEAASVIASDAPEAPSSPRSDLGILTPSFDTRSEVSIASRQPCAPSSPRIDPEKPLFFEDPAKTPMVNPRLSLQTDDLLGAEGVSSLALPTPLAAERIDAKQLEESVGEEEAVVKPEEPIVVEEAAQLVEPEEIDEHDRTLPLEEEHAQPELSGGLELSQINAVHLDTASHTELEEQRKDVVSPEVSHLDAERYTIVQSEESDDVSSSAFDGDIDSDHPESTIESVSESTWSEAALTESQDDFSERAHLITREDKDTVLSTTAVEQEDTTTERLSSSGDEISLPSDRLTTVHDSPVILASRLHDLDSIPTDSEPEFVGATGTGRTAELTEAQKKDLWDGMSELDTIHDESDDEGSVTPGDRSDLPQIPSSVSQLAFTEVDEEEVPATPVEGASQAEEPLVAAPVRAVHDVPASKQIDEFVSVETLLTTAPQQPEEDQQREHIVSEPDGPVLEMPHVDTIQGLQGLQGAVDKELPPEPIEELAGEPEEKPVEVPEGAPELAHAPTHKVSAPVVAVVDSGVDVGEPDQLSDLKAFSPTASASSDGAEPSQSKALPTFTLPTVLEDHDDVADFEAISPPPALARKRLESTASRFFPGAWVANTPVLPERPSLDVAQGEFSRPGSESGTLSPTTETGEEKKSRCVIM